MKNAGIAIGLVAIGAGLATIGLNMNGGGTAAHANAPMVQAGGPTIVWYGTNSYTQVMGTSGAARQAACAEILRGWSDGRVEVMTMRRDITGYNGNQFDAWCTDSGYCTKPWTLVSTPAQGYAAAADINADTAVDSADLTLLLGNWGDAPRHYIPSSDCPLNLINP